MRALAAAEAVAEEEEQVLEAVAPGEELGLADALVVADRALAEAHVGSNLIELYAMRGSARAQAGQTEGAVADIRRVIDLRLDMIITDRPQAVRRATDAAKSGK